MLYPSAVLAIMFGYQPPNDDTTARYKAVGEARDHFDRQFDGSILQLQIDASASVAPDLATLHRYLGEAALAYASAINTVAPGSGPVSSLTVDAINSVALARMWANKALRAPVGPVRGRLISLAKTESEKAQLAANAAIALDAPVADAYNGGP